jgi:hypothetical protein
MDSEFGDQGIFENLNTNSNLANRDAFFRNRVSEPYTLFDSFHRYRENEKFSYSFGSSGSKTFNTNDSSLDLTISGTNTDFAYEESKRIMPYQPGKSLLIVRTFVFASPQSNLRQRIGYFGSENGVYFEQNGNTLNFVLRSYVTGTVQERRINQSSWNGHKFDGSAFYNRQLDVTKANILWFDIEWLGVGDVRCGFIVDGVPVVAHTFHNDNLNTTTYMTTASLPLRAEIENLGTTSGASLKLICSTVISEGGYQGVSTMNNHSTTLITNDAKTLATPGTFYPLVSMKLKSTRLDAVVLPTQVDLVGITNDNFAWKILLNAGISTSSFSNYDTNSSVEVDTAATSISTTNMGTVLASGLIYQKSAVTFSGINNFNFQLGRTIQGTSDVITLAVAGSANTAKVITNLSWMELV